ncbi:hypothetical protein DL98DRAFT_117764 [Cadophora sp. DSE1049]|nr:hypothetical protein DL98DRAFT_117764 [Cadophora sp. DSE1049]
MTYSEDKTVAISGLQDRLASFYKTQSTYGIVHCYLHKSLLWQRSREERMQRISHSSVVPSWSWMAYEGEIRYRTSDLRGLNWEHIQLITTAHDPRSDAQTLDILTAPVGRIAQSCRIEGSEDANSKIRDAEGHLVGWIRYDCESEDNIERLGCIAVAQHRYRHHGWAVLGEDADTWKKYAGVSWDEKLVPGDVHYVLLLKRMAQEVYRRVGVAVIQSRQLSFEPLFKV